MGKLIDNSKQATIVAGGNLGGCYAS